MPNSNRPELVFLERLFLALRRQCPDSCGRLVISYEVIPLYSNFSIFNLSGCGHDALKVSSGADYEVKRHQPSLHQPYHRQSNLFNGRAWFKSNDGQRVIAYRPGCGWLIQPINYKYLIETHMKETYITLCFIFQGDIDYICLCSRCNNMSE